MPGAGGHSHSCGGCEHGQAGAQGEESGVEYSLYLRVDLDRLTCLNETTENSGRKVFKAGILYLTLNHLSIDNVECQPMDY